MILSNPIYDVVFKALMSDPDVAKGIIGRVLGREIIKLNFSHQEHPVREHLAQDGQSIMLMRMDFTALIKDEHGKEMQILIEIQKAKLSQDITRFRRYLGSQYLQATDIESKPNFIQSSHLPIFTIYLLNFCLNVNGNVTRLKKSEPDMSKDQTHESSCVDKKTQKEFHFHPPLVRIERRYVDVSDGNSEISPKYRSDFIESLTHDSFIVQIPLLSRSPKTPLERTFGLFNQRLIRGEDKHRLILDDGSPLLTNDPLLEKIARTLVRINADTESEKRMEQEDILQEDIERTIRKLEFNIEEIEAEKKEALIGEKKAREGKQQAEQREQQAQEEKQQAQEEKQEFNQIAIQALIEAGLTEEQAKGALKKSLK